MMALIVIGLGLGCAAIGGLLTYSGIHLFSDTSSTNHVHTIVANQISAHIDRDNQHESFQNSILIVIIGAVVAVGILFVLRYAAIGVMEARRGRKNNNNDNNGQILEA